MSRARAALPLLVALLTVVAGCAGPVGPETPTAEPSGTPAASATGQTDGDGYYRSYEVTTQPANPTTVARSVTRSREEVRADLTWRVEEFVTALFDEGQAERVVVASEPDPNPGPFGNDTLVLVDGRVDRLEKQVVDRHRGTGVDVNLEGPLSAERHDDYDRAEREAVAYGDLAPTDRGLFAYAAPPRDDPPDGVTLSGYTYVFPNESARASSALVDGERHYVRYGGEIYRLQADGERAGAVRYRVRYERRPAYDSLAALYEAREDELVTSLDGAGPTVERTVRDVVANGSTRWSGQTDAPARYRATWEWVRAHPPTHRGVFVRVDGELYRVRVLKAVE